MKHFMSFTLSIVIIAVVSLLPKYATAVIGDSGKPSESAIIDDNNRQSLLRDITKIKEEIKILQSKLNKAKEGENLTALYGGQSVKNLKELFNSLSSKIGVIGDGGKSDPTAVIGDTGKPSPRNIQKLSDGVTNGMIIINDLEQKVGRNMKSDSLQQLRNLSDVVNKLDAVLQGDQPEYRK